ncbi:MAG: hypothetical protein MSP08_00950 [Clostridiales bacterium]|nr:hypothetical protein [Clostridiales bacterium]MDY3763996.1 hypothetical protein [Candidatus Ventricola sp.]MDY4541883.1 hypothetical protein [Candidatus Ventricola sp.]MDY4855043.1 hypothetical protein [Candidatus Ventricola sp.]
MKKKMIWVLLAVVLVLAAAAAVLLLNKNDVVESTGPIVVTEEVTAEPETQEEAEAEALSEEAEIELVTLTGVITEITDEYVLLDVGDMGQVQANLSEDTLIEGVEELAIGQTAIVTYDGKMTRSLPAQITALRVGVYEVRGTVKTMEDGRITVEKTEGGDEVVLTLPENAPALAVGDVITAYTTGISTMSLPPQMNAIAIVK